MKIILEPKIALDLETMAVQTGGLEFSGLAFAEVVGEDLVVYDYEVMDVGSSALTEIPPEKIVALMKRADSANLRVWFHRHPVGNGVPGDHNWSGTDNDTIKKSPLGGIPQLVGWSASIVRTPMGWVGRFDNHLMDKTVHVEVAGQAPKEVYDAIDALRPKPKFTQLVSSGGKSWLGKRIANNWTPNDWTLDGDIEWEPEFNRDRYTSDAAYLEDLSAYYGAFVDEFDIAHDGTVYLDALPVGKVAPLKKKKFFGFW